MPTNSKIGPAIGIEIIEIYFDDIFIIDKEIRPSEIWKNIFILIL